MSTPLPGWYADSTNPSQLRWWDGSAWTNHTRGHPGAAAQQGPAGRIGAGPLYEANELVFVEQPAVGNAVSYHQVVDAAGRAVGSIHQTDAAGSVGVAVPARADSQEMYYRLFDGAGTPLLQVHQPYLNSGNIFKPRMVLTDGRGGPIGEIKADTAGMGRNRMSFLVARNPAGGLGATSWLSSKYEVVDPWKRQIAEIVKREYDEMPLPHIPANGDSYLLRRPQHVPEPLGTLVLMAAFAVDIAFHSGS